MRIQQILYHFDSHSLSVVRVYWTCVTKIWCPRVLPTPGTKTCDGKKIVWIKMLHRNGQTLLITTPHYWFDYLVVATTYCPIYSSPTNLDQSASYYTFCAARLCNKSVITSWLVRLSAITILYSYIEPPYRMYYGNLGCNCTHSDQSACYYTFCMV